MNGLPNPDFTGLTFVKGHGTENDFVLYADPDGVLPMDAQTAAWMADRRRGIGADGVIRAVRTSAADEIVAGLGVEAFEADWFMDYRNADGSVAEMCGNGARVFVEFLQAAGLADLPEGKCMPIATRGGVRQVWREGHNYAVDMGKWTFPTDSSTPADAHASAQPAQVEVQVAGIDNPLRGVRVDVPNPHVVVQVSEEQLQALDLSIPPVLTPAPANGANVEFIAIHPTTPPASTDDAVTPLTGQITMRVWERGVGETRSCGTGVVAAAIVGSLGKGDEPARWQVSVPGGELSVWLNGRAVLIGPAVLVHQGGLVPYTETL